MEKEWYKIISFNGSQANAFEELVCKVAMIKFFLLNLFQAYP